MYIITILKQFEDKVTALYTSCVNHI